MKVFVSGLILGVICLLFPNVNAMSVILNQTMEGDSHDMEYLAKLGELKKTLISKMKTISAILEYIDTYSKINSKTNVEKSNAKSDFNDPFVLSKIDVYLDDVGGPSEMPMDIVGSVLEAALHDRFKRSARKGKRTGEAEEEATENAERDAEGEEKKPARRSRKYSRKSRH